MKRFTTTLALLLLASLPMMAERVTPETARKAATNFLNNNGAKSAQLTDLSKAAGFDNLYIFTAEPGFVVMAADDCVQPILGYSLTGKFVAENMPTNVSGWLQGYSDEIQFAIDSKAKASAETAKQWKDLIDGNSKAAKATAVVNALVQTQWDQNGVYYYSGGQLQMFELYNNLCPYDNTAGERTVTGCVATAMAQIMKYWGYPSQGIGSHSYTPSTRPDLGVQSANFGETIYQWSDMPNKLSTTSTSTQINAIATLMYHCGVSVNMMYDISANGGSGAYAEDIPYALNYYFNYKATAIIKYKDSYSSDAWMNMLKTELDAGRPIQYGGSGTEGGHAFICDGYDNSNNFHFNWGWSGNNDGYYALTNLNPGSGGAGGGGYVFNNEQSAIFGIEPGSSIPAPTNLTYTLSGLNDITLTWNGVSAASSYNVYCDGNLVGNTTLTTYSETIPFGTHDYFVRCVDTNNQLSLPSNTVTVTIAYQTPIVTDLTAILSGNNANLSWTAPEWCYPETPSATLTYGDGNFNSRASTQYWAHRYLSDNLSQYANKAIYKISFYAYETGSYTCFIYKGASEQSYQGDNIFWPSTLMTSKTVEVTNTAEWIDIDLDEHVAVDGQDDIWVIMYDSNNGNNGRYSATFSTNTGNNNHGGYWGKWTDGNSNRGYVLNDDRAYLIRTCLTDGTYTYNLYDGTNPVASNIEGTSHTVSNIANNAVHQYTVKTNYYGGETAASNVIGFAKGTASVANLEMAANDQMTVTEGSKLTVTGTLSNDNAANLIIENGAQLIHNSDNVKATVKKTIEPYTTNEDGWNFIASPVTENITPDANNGLLTNIYDLYLFDQSQDKEWRNIRTDAFTTINHKTGYLYANSGNTTLTFAGTLVASAEPTALTYDANASLKGFNLIGNPYPCNTTITNDFYIIDGNGVTLAATGSFIAPCEGVFVKATDTEQTVTFSKANSAKGENSKDCFDLVVTQGKANIDRARVRFGEGIGMEKYALDSDKGSKIALWQEGQDFAVAYTNGQDEMPLNFKATQNGVYSISIEANSLDLDYLHLIDNLTGNDVDLLVTPNYTFESKTKDYASRFRLLFAPAEEIEVATDGFAFFADGHLHVFNQGNARLQLIDMTGHILLAETFQGNFDKALDLVPGVYIVRLISEKDTRSMKIVAD